MTQQEDEVRAQRAQRRVRLIEQAGRLNGAAAIGNYLSTCGIAEVEGFDALQFERWLLGVMRRSKPAFVGTYDPAKVQITIGVPADGDGKAVHLAAAKCAVGSDGFAVLERCADESGVE